MHAFAIITDTCADLPWLAALTQNVELARHTCMVGEAAYTYNPGSENDISAVYRAMREGIAVETLPADEKALMDTFEPHLAAGRDVLMLTVSRYLSDTFRHAMAAREALLPRYAARRIVLVDTLCAAMAQGMLVHETLEMRNDGKTLDDIADWVLRNRSFMNALLFPASLKWLREGGRFAGGAMGDLLGQRALLSMDACGSMRLFGRHKTAADGLAAMALAVKELGFALNRQVVGITHTQAPALAAELRAYLIKEIGCDAAILPMGPIVGRHVGPDAVGVAFFGIERQ
ncbi:MAG: DegV family EDD domain-containing protein [Clostridiales bacterium]|jgi:DegV family protein with EDD domain|nr:DegV family EDD domain-containing protein [Clostridiales bacterium]